MILSFILMFKIEVFYSANYLLKDFVPGPAYAYIIGISVALLIQFCRIAFGVSGAYEFAKGNTGKGIFGMLFSLSLAAWCSYEVNEIALKWAAETGALFSFQLLLQLIVWSGFALEIRLAIAVANTQEDHTEETKVNQTGNIIEKISGIPEAEQIKFSANGNGVPAGKK